MGRQGRIASWAAAVALAVAVMLAPVARADHEGVPVPNWSTYFPPGQNSASTVPLAFDLCPSGAATCPPRVVRQMARRWRPLDRSCDHNAVFSLTYLRTTEEFFRTTQREPKLFSDLPWINHEDAVFAQLYFNAVDGWRAGRSIPQAWSIAFGASRSANVSGTGDLLLGMNAHIQRDLPYTLAHVGLVKPDGSSRKPDHDKVNQFLDRVIDPLQDELNRRYDQIFGVTDASPSPADEIGSLQVVKGMREMAWRNAERLVNAKDAAERAQVSASIEAYSAASAATILASNTIPAYGPLRDAYCRSQHQAR